MPYRSTACLSNCIRATHCLIFRSSASGFCKDSEGGNLAPVYFGGVYLPMLLPSRSTARPMTQCFGSLQAMGVAFHSLVRGAGLASVSVHTKV